MPKRPKHRAPVGEPKRPRSIPPQRDGYIRISFAVFDAKSKWCEKLDDGSHFPVVAEKLKNYQSMRWTDVYQRDHRVLLGRLIPEAQERLIALKLDDTDELWRLRLDSVKRLWGIRQSDCFYALWWDPEHAVCPRVLKHT